MSKTLKQFLEVYKPKSPDEQKFVDKHVTIKHKDRNGNGDDVFTASNIKTAKRKEERHGYDAGEDEKVYEETELDESAKVAAHLIKRYGENVRKSHVRSAANDFGVDASKLAKAVRTKLGKTSLEEEVEQIDELSTDTLRKYREKARDDAFDAHDVDDDRRLRKRSFGANQAGKKILKRGDSLRAEEVEDVAEVAPPGAKYERMVKHIKKGYAKGGLTDRERAIAYATAWKAKKANEGVEHVVPTLKDQLIERISDLSESNQETMLSVFEQLSEDNKAKFVEYCDSPEGVNAMLDFAIDNRGE